MSKTPLSHYLSYTIDNKVDPAAVTNYGGLFPYLELMLLTGLPGILTRALPAAPARGWQHAEYIAALLALNLTGGDCVDDLGKLSDDPGIDLYMGQIRHALGVGKRRMARGGAGVLPSLTSLREWLDLFHHAAEEEKRRVGAAFIPAPNLALAGLRTGDGRSSPRRITSISAPGVCRSCERRWNRTPLSWKRRRRRR